MGLGGYPAVSLSNAIEKARQLKTDIDKGIDPISAKKHSKSRLMAEQAKAKTFEDCAQMFLATRTFTNKKNMAN